MIKSAILAHPEESRAGLSRPTIKKYILQKYPAAAKVSEATFSNHVSKAILKGTEKKVFTLPKGPSGKVKLAPSAKPAVKKPAAAKKPAAKPAAKKVKKTTTTAKKVSLTYHST
jgi:histone H1/5